MGFFLTLMTTTTAILVDGGFFLKRYQRLKQLSALEPSIAKTVANDLYAMCHEHLKKNGNKGYLYRILYYDCLPYSKNQHNPVSGRAIDYRRTDQSLFRLALFEELKKKRKVALRLGEISDGKKWIIRPEVTKKLLQKRITVEDINEDDVIYDLKQKRVDIKIGLDIASMTLKGLVNQIILISGDSDFVPAAKLARREGVDFILDPMWNPIQPHLFEHIDGLSSPMEKLKAPKDTN